MADTKISALTAKTDPADADQTNILDSEAANADKRMTMANLRKVVVSEAGANGELADFDAAGKIAASGVTAANVVTAAANITTSQLVVGSGGAKGVAVLAAGTNGQVLTMVEGVPAYADAAAGGGDGDVVGPESSVADQIAVFSDTTGKLIAGRATITATASAVTIGNADAATVQIGHATGGGLNVLGGATFNGALLSPGTGTNSFKAGPGAADPGNSSINIAGAVTGQEGVCVGQGQTVGNRARVVGIGQGLTIDNSDSVVVGQGAGNRGTVVGFLANVTQSVGVGIGIRIQVTGQSSVGIGGGAGTTDTAVSGANAMGLGRWVTVAHNNAVCIGPGVDNTTRVSSEAAFDFVLGVSAHNYKLPGTIITDLRFRTTTGTKIGTGTDQLIGFWNATPVDQPDAIADATDASDVITRCNDILAALRETGLIATA